MSLTREELLNERIPEIARLCSERERAAEEAERETEDFKKVEFMKKYEGEVFEGIISNVTSFGMFVELENTVEGLVRMSSMEDDYYVFNDKNYSLIGEKSRKVYRVGDVVRVMLVRADTVSRKIEFAVVGSEDCKDIETEIDFADKEQTTKETKRKRKRKVEESVLLHVKGKKKAKKIKR